MEKLEDYIIERDPEALFEVKQLFDANHEHRKRAIAKGICYGIKRTLDSLDITVIGIND